MRNLLEYPITDQEIVSTLKELSIQTAAEDASNFSAGSMEAIILMTAADIIASPKPPSGVILEKYIASLRDALAPFRHMWPHELPEKWSEHDIVMRFNGCPITRGDLKKISELFGESR